MLSPLLTPLSFDRLHGWHDDSVEEAFAAFRRSAFRSLEKPYRTGSLGIRAEAFSEAFAAARLLDAPDQDAARSFFESHFLPFHVRPDGPAAMGHLTGFYEPVIAASPVRTERFAVPFLARPDDLVDIDDENRPEGMDPYLAFARQIGPALVPYFDRAEIEQGALDGRDLEIAWVESRVDAFFAHVQGAARLIFPDGSERRITYAAKAGHRFTGPGRVLADLGEIPLRSVTMQSIRAWFAANPGRIDEILRQNRSYIFFRFQPVEDPGLGPVAAAKVPLTGGRSVAVDRLLHTFGTPVFINAPGFPGGPNNRLLIAQDTGSAIVGSARGDYFTGSGDAAGELAGVINLEADFFILVPRELAAR